LSFWAAATAAFLEEVAPFVGLKPSNMPASTIEQVEHRGALGVQEQQRVVLAECPGDHHADRRKGVAAALVEIERVGWPARAPA